MKVDVTQQLKRLDGTPLTTTIEACQVCGQPLEVEPAVLRGLLCNALVSSRRDQRAIGGKEQVERYELALRIQKEDEVELTTQEAAKLQELAAEWYTPLVTGQIWHILEGDNVTES